MPSNPLERIPAYEAEMSPTDKEIAAYVQASPLDTARSSIDVLAGRIGVSKSALVRFSNRIGYAGFSEFKFDLSRYLVSRNAASSENEENNPIAAITGLYASYITRIQESLTESQAEHIAALVSRCQRLKIFGYNRTYNAALQMRQRLAKIGVDAEAVYDTTLMNDVAENLNPEAVLIVFTIADNGGIYNSIVQNAAERGCPVIIFTMSQTLPFKSLCTEYVCLPRISKDSGISFLDDQAIYFVFIEVLMDFISKR